MYHKTIDVYSEDYKSSIHWHNSSLKDIFFDIVLITESDAILYIYSHVFIYYI